MSKNHLHPNFAIKNQTHLKFGQKSNFPLYHNFKKSNAYYTLSLILFYFFKNHVFLNYVTKIS